MGISGVAVIEYLTLHADIGGVAFQRSAYSDPIIARMIQFELETKVEIGVFFLGEQIAAAVCGTVEDTIFRHVSRAHAANERPSIQGLSIKNADKSLRRRRIC